MAGRSETAVTQAARALQGEWIRRVRPENGAHQYRFLPEAVGATPSGRSPTSDRPDDPDSFCGGAANDLTPDRQRFDPPSSNKKSFSKDKHSQTPEKNQQLTKAQRPGEENAVRAENPPRPGSDPDRGEANDGTESGGGRKATSNAETSGSEGTSGGREPATEGKTGRQVCKKESPAADFSDLSPEKRDLAKKLRNVGVWAGRIAEILSRFSRSRIRANFQLYRRRAAEQMIRKPGAWLCEAITKGYAVPRLDSEAAGSVPEGGALPPLEHKETVSEAEKDEYVAQGIPEKQFHRCLSGTSGKDGPRHMYFDPEAGGPTRRAGL
jgi:hypothetical protein